MLPIIALPKGGQPLDPRLELAATWGVALLKIPCQ